MQIVQKAVIKNGDKHLVVLRAPTAWAYPDHWDFPGGKLNPGEDLIKGIMREVFEEVSLDVKIGELLWEREMMINDLFCHINIYATDIMSGMVKLSHEHTKWQWLTKEEILALDKIFPAMQEYFKTH